MSEMWIRCPLPALHASRLYCVQGEFLIRAPSATITVQGVLPLWQLRSPSAPAIFGFFHRGRLPCWRV